MAWITFESVCMFATTAASRSKLCMHMLCNLDVISFSCTRGCELLYSSTTSHLQLCASKSVSHQRPIVCLIRHCVTCILTPQLSSEAKGRYTTRKDKECATSSLLYAYKGAYDHVNPSTHKNQLVHSVAALGRRIPVKNCTL